MKIEKPELPRINADKRGFGERVARTFFHRGGAETWRRQKGTTKGTEEQKGGLAANYANYGSVAPPPFAIAPNLCLNCSEPASMDRIYTQSISLSRLRLQIEKGVFAVPELQREFVWNANKVCDLLDSVYRNYPIGTILIWKTHRRNETQLRKKFHILPSYNRANRHIYFLIDGQQRLSVLWHVLRGQAAAVTNADGKELNFGNIYFVPFAAEGESLFIYRKRFRGEMPNSLIPVVDMLAPGWRRRIRGLRPRALKRVEECRHKILSYEAVLLFCETGSRTDVRETFIRINSLGMRIGAADRAFARASKFDLRHYVREAQASLKQGFERVNRTTILQAIALMLGVRDLGERAINSMISRLEGDESAQVRFERDWPRLREAFAKAVDFFIYELQVPNYDFLPSEPMLMVLALFFFHNGNVRPFRAAKKRIRQWFWATAVGARYTGRGYRPNILKDAASFERLASNAGAQFDLKVRIPVYMLFRTEYGRPGPLSNAFFCLLRLLRPRYLEDGSQIPFGEISSRRDHDNKHHIFPRALLRRCDIDSEKSNSIVNICYLVARENQRIGQRPPASYLLDVPRSKRARRQATHSHLIPFHEGRGILDRSTKRGFKTFLEDRASLIIRAFEKQASMRLFERS